VLNKDALRQEDGNVLVVAIILIGIMMAIGLATLSRADGQTAQSRVQRNGESTFNLAEGALSQQIFILGRKGPGTATNPYPAACASTLSNTFCPDNAKLMLNYDKATQSDFDPGQTKWRTWVRDNASAVGVASDTFWTDSLLGDPTTGVGGRPRFDQNADKLMWVRAQAQVRGRDRAIVGLIRIEPNPVELPKFTILSGTFETTNNGGHSAQIVDTTGSLGVTVRCGAANGSGVIANCLEYEPKKGQIVPDVTHTGYGESTTLSPDDLEALVDVARANGTYYTSKPASLSGDVVVLDPGGSTLWKFTGNDQFNTPSDPGLVILLSGKLELNGTTKLYGAIYHANLGNSTDSDLVKVHGNSQLVGGVVVDGKGGVEAGSSGKLNIKFDPNAFTAYAFGTAGVVQNTWREIRPLVLP
jgi:type II secretory pathway pseudopilin PulG